MRKIPARKEMDSARSVTWIGGAVNVFLIGLKFAAGIFGHSHALIADAVHSISDLFTDVVVLFGLQQGRKPPDERHNFGHGRIETLSASVVGLALISTALYLGFQATSDIYHHNEYHPTLWALLGAGVSIALKETLYHYTVHAGRRIKSRLIEANAWHHRSDALSSVAVLLGVACARIRPNWHIFDAFAALIVSFFIIKAGLDILRQTVQELSDAAPGQDILEKINRCTLGVGGVMDAHDLRVRSVGGRYQIEIHILVDAQWTVAEGHRTAKAVEQCVLDDIDDAERVIVHVDPSKIGGG